MRSKLIANPHAGYKGGIDTNPATLEDVRAALAAHGIVPDVETTRGPGHATQLARTAAFAGYDTIIAAGGDGTVREVAIGLLGSGAPLGIMPLGSFMNVAHMLGIPRDPQEAAAIIAAGDCAHIDVGRAGNTYFLEAAGVGIDAALFPYTNRLDRWRWRALGRALPIALWYRPQRVILELDWWTVEMDALMVTVANGPYCGAAFTVAPNAMVDDHQLDVRVFGPMPKLRLLRCLLHPEGERAGRVYDFKAREVRISAPRALPGHADSVSIGTTPLRFSLLPVALPVYVPAEPRTRPAALSQAPTHLPSEAPIL